MSRKHGAKSALDSRPEHIKEAADGSLKRLGSLEVSALGLGCMSIAYAYSLPADRQMVIRLFRAAYDRTVPSVHGERCENWALISLYAR